jgi:hypothetical protein
MQHKAFSVHLERNSTENEVTYFYSLQKKNKFEGSNWQPGLTELRVAATTLHRLQLCKGFGSSASNKSDHYSIIA